MTDPTDLTRQLRPITRAARCNTRRITAQAEHPIFTPSCQPIDHAEAERLALYGFGCLTG